MTAEAADALISEGIAPASTGTDLPTHELSQLERREAMAGDTPGCRQSPRWTVI
jgi:hypothetical protein